MIKPPNSKVERFRLRQGQLQTTSAHGNNGAFLVPHPSSVTLACIVSDGMGWEHVSVHVNTENGQRIPTWDEMCYVKDLFWEPYEAVIQIHPPHKEYINCHPFVLHLWRPTCSEIRLPPRNMIAPDEFRKYPETIQTKETT